MVWRKKKIIQKIYWSVDRYGRFNPQQYSQVKSVLQKLNNTEVFEILYTVLTDAERSRTRFADQEFAGSLLFQLQPYCTLEPTQAIENLVQCCNVSIEEISRYFAQQYGNQAVLEILAELKTKLNSEKHQRSIETWEWWLQRYPENI